MNNILDMNRLGKVIKRDFYTFYNNFGINLAVIAAIPVLSWIMSTSFKTISLPIARVILISCLLVLVIIWAPAGIYRKANHPREGVDFAMLPASALEKFLSMAFYCIIVTPLLFLASCVIIDFILYWLPFGAYNSPLTLPNIQWNEIFEAANNPDYTQLMKILKISIPFVIPISIMLYSSIFMLGNMLFQGHKTTKTIASLIGISWVVQIIFAILFSIITLNHNIIPDIESILDNTNEEVLKVVAKAFIPISLAFNALISFVCMFFTYRKIKTQRY